MATTVVRIKRSLKEDPQDTLVLNCKRRKLEESSSTQADVSPTIFRFVGTVQNPDDAVRHIKENKPNFKEYMRRGKLNSLDARKQENAESAKNARLKIINEYRSIDLSCDPESDDCRIVDLEHDGDMLENFVYDLYCTSSNPFDSDCNLVTDESDYRHENFSEDSDDSNAENYYKNDYPEEQIYESMDNEYVDDLKDDLSSLCLSSDYEGDDFDMQEEYDRTCTP